MWQPVEQYQMDVPLYPGETPANPVAGLTWPEG
jgi:hypothetical protein